MGPPMERREWKAATRSRARAGAAATRSPPNNTTWIQHAGFLRVYCDARWSRKRRGFYQEIDSYSQVESEMTRNGRSHGLMVPCSDG